MQGRLTPHVSVGRLELKYLVVGVLCLAFFLAFSTSSDFSAVEGPLLAGMETALAYGAVGLFLIAFFSNLVVIINIPFMLVALPWVVADPTLSGVLLFSAATGIGAGLGKLLAYRLASNVIARFPALSNSPVHRWVSTQIRRRPRFAPALVFVAAGTPLPLDPALMPLLLVGYPAHRVAAPLLLGKVLQSLTLALGIVLMSASLGVGDGMNVDLTLAVVVGTLLLVAYQIEKARHSRPALAPAPVRINHWM